MENKRLSIIWNLTQRCLWNCAFCCVDAKKEKGFDLFNKDRNPDFSLTMELTYNQKKKIIAEMNPDIYRIDFSGGELFLDPLNTDLILFASDHLGSENIGISTSGALITEEIASKLQGRVSDVEVTMDVPPFKYYKYRPIGYHEYAEKGLKMLKKYNIHTGIQTVLTPENSDRDSLIAMMEWAETTGIDEWSLLKFIPVGRGTQFEELSMSNDDYAKIVDTVREISQGSSVEISFQYLLPNHDKHTEDCRAVKKSIGILPNGNVISCFWALGKNMTVIDDTFNLGSVVTHSIDQILHNDKCQYWLKGKHECIVCPNNTAAAIQVASWRL